MKSIFVAIDTPDLDHARTLANAVRSSAGGVKLGLEFFCANGPGGVHEIASSGLPTRARIWRRSTPAVSR